MAQVAFSPEWINQFTDPYAVLGVSVAADERRILKRYRVVAKLLHPDSYATGNPAEREVASQLFARLVSPAYQKLKQERDRAETLAMLRFQVRRLHRTGALSCQSDVAKKLMQLPWKEAEIAYEQTIADLSETQYQPLTNFAGVTQQLMEVNQAYFFVKMGDTVIREKRTGLVASTEAKPTQYVVPKTEQEAIPAETYARRHYERAQSYLERQELVEAIQELRDAIKIDAHKSEYHAALGLAYLKQNLTGMAAVYFRQALKLNPNDPLAREYAAKLNLQGNAAQPDSKGEKPSAKATSRGGFFGLFGGKK